MSDILDFNFNHSQENIFGGHDFYDQSGSKIGYSTENIFGGHDLHSSDHNVLAHSQSNIFGGVDLVEGSSGELLSQTRVDQTGTSVFDSNGMYAGHGTETAAGGEFIDIHGIQTSWQNNIFGGVSGDPFSSLNTLQFPPLL